MRVVKNFDSIISTPRTEDIYLSILLFEEELMRKVWVKKFGSSTRLLIIKPISKVER